MIVAKRRRDKDIGHLPEKRDKSKLREDRRKIEMLERDGRIDFASLPVIEPRVREILLKWLSDALEDADYTARTDDGRLYVLDTREAKESCVVHCEDGNFTMPKLAIVFQEETGE